ncbi:MAG: glycosyltransferase family 2 protein [Actinobacteria bacterium]|nr:glycosyltransferase family 2 protein [Actinomycetota bacterium]
MRVRSLDILEKGDICAIIVTYDGKAFISNTVKNVKKKVNHIVIIDNNSTDGTREYLETIKSTTLTVINNKKNYGIAHALNQGFEFAKRNGFFWVLTMDQDSSLSDNMIGEMSIVYNKLLNKDKVVCLAPKVVYSKKDGFKKTHHKEFYEKTAVITSGSLVKTQVFNEIGGFEEKLFIDSVDFDFCLKLKERGYKILICNNATMLHSLGEIRRVKMLNRDIIIHIHPSIRKYYMSRNYIYIMNKYFINHTCFCLKMSLFYLIFILQTVIYEKKVISNLKIILEGISDGIRGNFGEKLDLKIN